MTKMTYEIPPEMRDFAEKSLEQSRKAFEGFFGAVQKAVGSVENSPFPMPAPVKDVSAKAVNFAEANVKSAFDHAHKLVQAKDVQEVMSLQADFLKSQLATLQEQAKEMGETVKDAVTQKSGEFHKSEPQKSESYKNQSL